MDGSRFDDLARSFAASTSRRRFIGGLAGAALGLAGLRTAGAATCRDAGSTCNADRLCCSGLCGDKDRTGRRRCACPPGTEDCGGACVNPNTAYVSDTANCGACGHSCPRTKCQVATCTAGVCGLAPDPRAVGKLCDDGNACTLNDVCRADGSCAGTPITCSAKDQCHDAGTCDPATGKCTNPDKPNGATCDDGDACTQTDTCQSGVCVGSNPVVCMASDQCHAEGVCDPRTGTCSNPKKADGSACNDGDACTRTDSCRDGVCVGSDPVVCDPPDQCHEAGVCDSTTGTCTYQPKTDNTPCDDGDKCTIGDTCQSGVCTPGANKTCTASDQCHNAGSCDPATGECSDPAKPNDTPCDDGDACTRTDTCQSGVCVGTNPVACVAQDQCHDAGTCDPATGQCSNPEKPNGVSCSDNNACTLADTCQNGVCTPETDVICEPTANPCQEAGICNATTGQCEYADKPNGTDCVSGNKCRENETCTAGVCGGGTAVNCDDGDKCTVDSCDPDIGCIHTPKVCDDANICTADSCDPPSGQCVYTPIICDDGDPCTIGSCNHPVGCIHTPRPCPPPDQCHEAGVCNSATGDCEYTPKTNGAPCDDGNLCTQSSSCQNGVCVGGDPVVCTASDQCHDAGTCDPATGQCSNPTKADGSGCNDGDACTRTDTCQNGVCVGSNPVVCTALDQCHDAGSCDPATGKCSNPNKSNGTSCNDGNACTVNDTCQNGVCTAGGPGTCEQCGTCPLGHACASASECQSQICSGGTCSCMGASQLCGWVFSQPPCSSCCNGNYGAPDNGICR